MTKEKIESEMSIAFEPFIQYTQCLAQGKLDCLLNSFCPEVKKKALSKLNLEESVKVTTGVHLLLHDIGQNVNEIQLEKVFCPGTTFVVFCFHMIMSKLCPSNSHLFNTSGAGKTRISLDGLCQNWGLYFSCQSRPDFPSGSNDFQDATKILTEMKGWGNNSNENSNAARHVFAMMYCVRMFLLKEFVNCLPQDTRAIDARRRWVLFQVLPPYLTAGLEDVFSVLLKRLDLAKSGELETVYSDLEQKIFTRGVLPTDNMSSLPFYIVIDEAQVAADRFSKSFRSESEQDFRPILREFYKFFMQQRRVKGIVIAGTGLSQKAVHTALASSSAKATDRQSNVFFNTGLFLSDDPSQTLYIRKYLDLSGNNTDNRLMQRIQRWFAGRYVIMVL